MTSRTDVYEDTLRQIEELRNSVIPSRTMARAYTDYANAIHDISYGTLADNARDDLVVYAMRRADEWRKKAKESTTRADKLEQGIS